MSTTEQTDFDRRLFTIAEAADHLRISKTMVFKLIRTGRLRPTKIGTRTLISGAAIEHLLAPTAG
jgi:excisionase family DNA binding protein